MSTLKCTSLYRRFDPHILPHPNQAVLLGDQSLLCSVETEELRLKWMDAIVAAACTWYDAMKASGVEPVLNPLFYNTKHVSPKVSLLIITMLTFEDAKP